MITYKEFLEFAGIISEEDFDSIIKSLPEINIEDLDQIYNEDLNSCDDVAKILIQSVLNHFDWVCCTDVNFDEKSFELIDVKSASDLDEIEKIFLNWNITNIKELKEELLEEEKENNERADIISAIKCLDTTVLQQIYNTYCT